MDTKKMVTVIVKSFLLSIIFTIIFVAVLALLAWILHWNNKILSIGVVIIDVLACLFGGLLAGKGMGEKKYLWGLLIGGLYFIVMMLVAVFMDGQGNGNATSIITSALLCLGSGMLGGMIG